MTFETIMNFINAEIMPHFDIQIFYYLCVFSLGCISAFAELLSRYYYTFTILRYKESYLYLVINGGAAVVAYLFINQYKINFGPLTEHEIGKICTAGLSSMVILRSSFSNIKINNKTVDVGLAPVLQVFLNAADRAFDQSRSQKDFSDIAEMMKNVDASKAHRELLPLCTDSMQNVSNEEVESAIGDLIKVDETDLRSNYAKSITIGLILYRLTGLPLLKTIIESLGNEIQTDADTPPIGPTDEIQEQEEVKFLKEYFYKKFTENEVKE